ncbi:MAG: Cell shape-determining protein MreC [Opitutia bacterium UBA7350]|nr:MAG: Cell shape-determining protein MreC [Opitutae bacterium UBA7350]
MAKLRLDRLKPLVALAAFLFLWWILPAAVKSFTRLNLSEFHAPAWLITDKIDQLSNFWAARNHSKIELLEAGRDLARTNARYQILAQRYQNLEKEIERLESLLDLPPQQEYHHEIARVVRRDLNAWWQEIIIRKGRDYEIPIGAAVIFSGGIVGRVIEVNAYSSRVELISSPRFRMAASFDGDSRPVVYQGRIQSGFVAPRGEVSDVPQDLMTTSRKPLSLVSNQLGGTFPAGLKIGTVPWLAPGSTGIFQTGAVELDKRLHELKEVTVLIPLILPENVAHAN